MENIENLEFDPKIDYNIFNALNLVNEELGNSYAQNGFNPFETGFCLDEFYIKENLSTKAKAYEIDSPDFINNGPKQTAVAFENAKNNSEQLIIALTELLSKENLSQSEIKKLKYYIAQLKCFKELLNIFIAKLKKEKNLLEMYKKALAINWELAHLLKQTFEKDYNQKQVLENLMFVISNKNAQIENEDAILKEQAKQIIQNNLKKQQLQKQTQQKEQQHIESEKAVQSQPVKEDIEKAIKKPLPAKKQPVKKQQEKPTIETEEQIER